MGVNHRGAHVSVAQELLYGADVIAAFQEVGRKGMAEGVAAGVLVHAGLKHGLLDGTLHEGFVHVVAALFAGSGVDPAVLQGEQPLPFELFASRGIFRIALAALDFSRLSPENPPPTSRTAPSCGGCSGGQPVPHGAA